MRRLFIVAILLTPQLVLGQEFLCTVEKLDSGDEHCVFRDVNLRKNTAGARFAYPADVAKPSQVTFVDSNMKQLPSNFLTLAGPELRVLRVENCGLVSVTITSGLEELHAKGNSIEKVIVHQSGSGGPLRSLDLSGNELNDVTNLTKCQALEELNLSGNKLEDVLDLGKFKGLNNLRKLDLTHNNINYLDNTGNVNLESLEDLNLGHNNIIPSDLNIAIFYPFAKLHTLRLNDNLMSQLDYNHLLNIKPLKTVYLNGNNFKCDYLESMLKHLQQNNLQTPPGQPTSCPDKVFNDFCCTGSLPTKPTPPTTKAPPIIVDPTKSPATDDSIISPTEESNRGSNHTDDSLPSWTWIVAGVGIALIVIAAAIGVVVWKKQQKKGTNYQMPPGNVELS